MNKTLQNMKKNTLIQYAVLAIILNLVIEIMNRRSITECVKFIYASPFVFLYNAFIIFFTFSITLLLRRRLFALSFLSIVWLIIGIVNCVILGFRMTPFSAIDILLAKNALQISSKYLSFFEMVLIAVGIVLLVVAFVIMWIKLPKDKEKKNYLKNLCAIAIITVFTVGLTKIGVSTKLLSNNFENLGYAYQNYGFAYCFSNSIIDRGISKPSDYSEETMAAIKKQIDSKMNEDNAAKENEKTPNIIMVQLESFFDINNVKGLSFSEQPIPNWVKLKENYSHGFLTVPSVGAGTANTEFEILTGMNTDYFGAGEYPYKTVLSSTPTESLSTVLKQQGYSTAAIHNNDGTFYNRNTVYANLGFDSFTPIEYMYNLTYNPLNWVKDENLTGVIKSSLDATKNQDFVFTVSVQGHGRYPSTQIDSTQKIQVSGNDDNKAALEYYTNQINEMDTFVGDLIKMIESRKEPTVLILYGDHLPTLGLTDEDLTNKDLFQTEYVMWDNIGLSNETKDLNANELNNYVFDRLQLKKGIIQTAEELYSSSSDYTDKMKLIEYDLLYGNQYLLDSTSTFTTSDMKMGYKDISVESVSQTGEDIIVKGSNFNEFSKVLINDSSVTTEYVDENTLKVTATELKDKDKISVGQYGDDNIELGQCDNYEYSTQSTK